MPAAPLRRPKKLHLRRKAIGLLLLVLLLLLFELNQFLPGVWRGAGNTHGSRTDAATLVGESAGPDQPVETDGSADDPTSSMRTPEEAPPEIPRDGVLVELRLADGTVVTEWSYGAGENGVPRAVDDPAGRAPVRAGRVEEPICCEHERTQARHHPLSAGATPGHWIVVLPDGESRPGRVRERLTLRAFDGDAPIESGEVEIETARETITRSLVNGALVVTGLRTLARATLLGRRPVSAWFHPRGAEDVILRAPTTQRVTLQTTDGALTAGDVGFVAADGRTLESRLVGSAPDAAFEVEVQTGQPVYAVGRTQRGMGFLAAPGPAMELPETRIVTVEVSDADGAAASGGTAHARFDAPIGEGRSERFPLTALGSPSPGGGIQVELPRGRPAQLVVATPAGVVVREIAGGDADEQVALTLPGSRSLTIRVEAADGAPVAGAEVRAAIAPGTEARARTDESGRAALAGLPTSTFAVYVAADGFAPRTVLPDDEPETIVRLAPAAPLEVVVSDPNGVPLSGVRVDVEPMRGTPRAESPGAPRMVLTDGAVRVRPGPDTAADTPDRTDEDGRFVLDDLASRAYRIRLYHPDYEPLTVREVEPAAGRTWFLTLLPR